MNKRSTFAFALLMLTQSAWAAPSVAGQNPKDADALIWEGILIASYAGAKGGIGALSLVKEAKAVLEEAIALDPRPWMGRPTPAWAACITKCRAGPWALATKQKLSTTCKRPWP